MQHLLAIEPVTESTCISCCEALRDLDFWVGSQHTGRCKNDGCGLEGCGGFACRTGENFRLGNTPEFQETNSGEVLAYVCNSDGTVISFEASTSSPTKNPTLTPTPFPTDPVFIPTTSPTRSQTPIPTTSPFKPLTPNPTTSPFTLAPGFTPISPPGAIEANQPFFRTVVGVVLLIVVILISCICLCCCTFCFFIFKGDRRVARERREEQKRHRLEELENKNRELAEKARAEHNMLSEKLETVHWTKKGNMLEDYGMTRIKLEKDERSTLSSSKSNSQEEHLTSVDVDVTVVGEDVFTIDLPVEVHDADIMVPTRAEVAASELASMKSVAEVESQLEKSTLGTGSTFTDSDIL